jgi:hypothetical protein
MTTELDFLIAQTDTVVDILKHIMDDDTIVAIYNHYAERNRYSRIIPMGELDNVVSPAKSVSEILRMFDRNFSPNHDYFTDVYKIVSGTGRGLVENAVNYKLLAEYLIEEGDPEGFLEKYEDQLRESFILASQKGSVANELFKEWEEWLNDNLYNPELRDNKWVDLFDSLWDSFEEYLWAKDANE